MAVSDDYINGGELTVNQMIDFLNECRDRGMGEAKILVRCNDGIDQAGNAFIDKFRRDEEDDDFFRQVSYTDIDKSPAKMFVCISN